MPPTQLKPICERKLENSISVHGRAAVGIDTYAILTAGAVGVTILYGKIPNNVKRD